MTDVAKYPVPEFDAEVVGELMPDQRQAAPYVAHIPTGVHSDDVAPALMQVCAAPITSRGPRVPYSPLTHRTTAAHLAAPILFSLPFVQYTAAVLRELEHDEPIAS